MGRHALDQVIGRLTGTREPHRDSLNTIVRLGKDGCVGPVEHNRYLVMFDFLIGGQHLHQGLSAELDILAVKLLERSRVANEIVPVDDYV